MKNVDVAVYNYLKTVAEGSVQAGISTGTLQKSHLSRIIGLPIYQNMTIRNWNTTTKLLNMMRSGNS